LIAAAAHNLLANERLIPEAADFTLHSLGVTAIGDASQVGCGNRAKCSDFDEGFQFGFTKEISAVAKVMSARRIEGLRLAVDCVGPA